MRRFALSLVFLIFGASSVFSEANIPVKNRVHNQMPGYCAWASLETVCRHQKVKAGYDLVEKRKLDPDYWTWDGRFVGRNEGTDLAIEGKLKGLGIKFQMNPTWAKNRAGIRMMVKATEAGKGAVIGVWHDPVWHGHHAIVVTDINEKTFKYIDSNHPDKIWEGSVDWLLQEWDGFVCVVEK